jgi:HD-GYP domain-containing protein (c-di-GMP phosphodiesterase class II)
MRLRMGLKFPFLNQSLQLGQPNKTVQNNLFESPSIKNQPDLFNFKNSVNSDTFSLNSANSSYRTDVFEHSINPIKFSIFSEKPVTKPNETNPVFVKSLLQKPIDTGSVANSLVNLIDLKDSYTGAHSQAVQYYSDQFVKKLNISNLEAESISLGAAFHDIGKIGIPESILNSSSRLTDEEYKKIKEHPVLGDKILEGLPSFKGKVSKIVRHHHESWDGSGYPDNLSGTDIPLGARIVAIADSYHAMTSDRPYRKGLPVKEAVNILKDGAGKQWDPNLVDKFIQTIPEFK